MSTYNYQINFSLLKKWLPQTTKKIIYYLENLNNSQENNSSKFDINKTKWELCAKPKNNKGAINLQKIIELDAEPTLEDFKKLLELSHNVEIYVKGIFNTITYRSSGITYLSYKNQHDFIAKKEVKKDNILDSTINNGASKLINAKGVRLDVKTHELMYLDNGVEHFLHEAKFFSFEDNEEKIYAMAHHNSDDKKIKSFSLYEVNLKNQEIKVKYFLEQKTSDAINKIKDLNYHEINGKKVKIVLSNITKFKLVN